MINKFLLILFLSLTFIGCSKTTVVLLDSGKNKNTILVTNDKGEKKLNKVGDYLDLGDKDKELGKVKTMSSNEIQDRFSKALAIESAKPISYIVYFKPKSKELTDESNEILKEAIKSIKKRSPCVVDIIGHTDTTGSHTSNAKVSLKRAKYVESIINQTKIKIHSLVTKGFGEEDLLVETADNVDEEKNRNVEIYIK